VSGRITVFDTTLRDGEQSPGCSMNAAEKVRLARQLEKLGVDVIEAGFPIASLGEVDSVKAVAQEIRGTRVAALARAKEADVEAAGKALSGAARPMIHTFLATSAIHLKYKLKITADEALRQAVEAVTLARSMTPDVEFSAEDASRTDYGYLREVLQAVFAAGAGTLNVPDTVGYSLPDEYAEMVRNLVGDIPGAVISVHCHNDLGLAVANSIAAVQAGAMQVECTINGIGERAGNTSLEELVMALKVRSESLGAQTGVKTELLAPTSVMLSNITGVWPQPNKAIVGRNAFAHEAGIHQDGVLKNPLTYEIMTPASVGVRETLLVLGKHSGKHAVESRLKALGLSLSMEEIEDVTTKVKELADRKKFVYDDDLLALVSGAPRQRARLVRYQVVSGNDVIPTATVEIEFDGERRTASAAGNGPLDAAMKAAEAAFGFDLELLELHTRALTAGTDALAEVIVRVRHGETESTGQAASTDSTEAALRAYLSAVGSANKVREAADGRATQGVAWGTRRRGRMSSEVEV
jgi:2-isopropylmalate synthase